MFINRVVLMADTTALNSSEKVYAAIALRRRNRTQAGDAMHVGVLAFSVIRSCISSHWHILIATLLCIG